MVVETGLLGWLDNPEVRGNIKISRGKQGVVPDVMDRACILPDRLIHVPQNVCCTTSCGSGGSM